MTRRGLYGLALAAFVALGLPDGTLGVAWPSIRAELRQPVSALGVLLVAQTVGYLVVTARNGALVGRFGTGRLLAASAGTAATGFIAYALAAPWAFLIAASVAVGAAGGAVDAGVNAHVAVHHGRRAMGLLHAAFGIGATAGPLLVTALLQVGRSWQAAYLVLVVSQLLLLGSFLRTRTRWLPPPVAAPAEPGARRADDRRAVAVLTAAAFFVYTGLEIATGQWAYSLLTEQRGTTAVAAGLWVAAYWAALTAGRLLLAVGADRFAPAPLLTSASLGALAGTVVLWLDPAGLGAAALPLIGLCLAPVFPTLVSLTPERLGPERAAHAIGHQLAAAGVGAAALPGAVALAIGAGGLDALGPSLVALATALVVVQAATRRAAAGAPPVALIGDRSS